MLTPNTHKVTQWQKWAILNFDPNPLHEGFLKEMVKKGLFWRKTPRFFFFGGMGGNFFDKPSEWKLF